MNKIHQEEDALSTIWERHYENLGLKESFCFDGLCYNGSVYNNDCNCEIGNEELLWTNAKRKILFLMKDTNENPNCDYRDWSWHLITNPFFKLIFAWLHGLTNITQENYPPLEDGYCNYNKNYPLTIVNIKKASGINRVSNDELWEYAYQDAKLIREQVVTILKPNIIVCGGGSSTILNIAKQIIYQDTFFVKINDWCYYSKEKDLLLIDSWHPKAIISLEDKYDKMMIAVRDFISKTESNTFQQ